MPNGTTLRKTAGRGKGTAIPLSLRGDIANQAAYAMSMGMSSSLLVHKGRLEPNYATNGDNEGIDEDKDEKHKVKASKKAMSKEARCKEKKNNDEFKIELEDDEPESTPPDASSPFLICPDFDCQAKMLAFSDWYELSRHIFKFHEQLKGSIDDIRKSFGLSHHPRIFEDTGKPIRHDKDGLCTSCDSTQQRLTPMPQAIHSSIHYHKWGIFEPIQCNVKLCRNRKGFSGYDSYRSHMKSAHNTSIRDVPNESFEAEMVGVDAMQVGWNPPRNVYGEFKPLPMPVVKTLAREYLDNMRYRWMPPQKVRER